MDIFHIFFEQVSWIRLRNLHVLTVDRYVYSTDERVSVVHNEASREWVLRIRGAHRYVETLE